MSDKLPKAVFYYNPRSIWSSSVLITLEEKGYGVDELERKIVDLSKAENLSLPYLRINPKGTIPALVVPLATTLSTEVESRYKAVQDTKSIVEFLDKSRSATSRTHTTSVAPAPSLAPATIALSSKSNTIIELLHSEDADPSELMYHTAFDVQALRVAARYILPYISSRLEAILSFIAQNQQGPILASEKTRTLWTTKKAHHEDLLAVYANAAKETEELSPEDKAKREQHFARARLLWQDKLKKVFVTLDKEVVAPFALGDQLSLVDLHLGPWLARVAYLTGGAVEDNGETIISKIFTKIGNNFTLPKEFQPSEIFDIKADPALRAPPGAKTVKLAAFWDEVKLRKSWAAVYGTGLH